MKNAAIWFLGIGIVLLGGFFLLNSYIYNEKQDDGEPPAIAVYFQEQMIERGIQDIGHPIEGFDANLLILAFPGLVPGDFQGVETFEGHYEIQGGEIVFMRARTQPISSAERTVSQKGYDALLENVSARLGIPVMSETDVDALIERIDTGERIETRIGQGARALDVTVTP